MKKLKFSQANIITSITSLLISLLSLGLVIWIICLDPTYSLNLSLTILLSTSWLLFNFIVTYILVSCIFNLPEKAAKEEIIAKYNLTKTEYTQVHYTFPANKGLLPFLLIAHAEYYFYAKLNEKEELHLLVKNKTQDIIYNSTVRFQYFNAHFRKIE